MVLTLREQAGLLVHAINSLGHKNDILVGETEGCCPTCCLPCSILADLARSGRLEEVIVHEPTTTDYMWWSAGRVDRSWLDVAWNHEPCPNHEPVEEPVTDSSG